MMKENIEKLLKHYQMQLKHVLDEYDFKICDVCLLPHDGDGCTVCPRCDGCGETVEQVYPARNGDDWCKGCIENTHRVDDLMREYNQSR